LAVIFIFGVIFANIQVNTALDEKYPSVFKPVRSHAQLQKGNVYDICAPIEQLIAINKGMGKSLELLRS
jgi:hypothetical protein